MKSVLLILLVILMTVSTLDITDVKIRFCEKLKGHWAYDRLKLKHNCLEMVRQIGLKLCIDVNKNNFLFC